MHTINKMKFTIEAKSIFRNSGLYGEELYFLWTLAISLIKKYNLKVLGIREEIIHECVLITFYVNKTINEMAELNWELAGVFAHNVTNMRSDVLIFEYSSKECFYEKNQ